MSTKKKLLLGAAGTAAAGGANLDINNVFSTFLYEGNDTDTDIVNGIDLTEGGLVWIKARGTNTSSHRLIDSAWSLSANDYLDTSSSTAPFDGPVINTFNTNGFNLDSNWYGNYSNSTDGGEYVSWTFRKAPKFFDVVTWTSNGSSTERVNHNLGAVPGHIVMKRTDASGPWLFSPLYSDGDRGYRQSSDTFGFDSTGVIGTKGDLSSGFTATDFRPLFIDGFGTYGSISGATYVAYLFAHNNNDGEFGPDSDQDIIKCGSYTGTGSTGNSITLGFEPQWIMVKNTSASTPWVMVDVMRGMPVDGTGPRLLANASDAEVDDASFFAPRATGFEVTKQNTYVNTSGQTYIYMAIRRGPLAAPDDATKVFNVNTYSNNGNSNIYNTGFDVDMSLSTNRDGNNNFIMARITGTKYLQTNATSAQGETTTAKWFNSKSNSLDLATNWWGTNNAVSWAWKRAPSYFDVVAYTGTGSARTVSHNLGVAPEMIWIKRRDSTRDWATGFESLGWTKRGPALNSDEIAYTVSTYWNDTAPTSSVFTVGSSATVNASGGTFIAYLFATVPNVSKCGSYSGNGGTQNIECGFSNGSRFILIKRTDTAEGWKVHDSARGIVAGDDPFIELNNTNAENSSFDLVDPYSGGFAVNNYAGWNASGGSYIFYAIA